MNYLHNIEKILNMCPISTKLLQIFSLAQWLDETEPGAKNPKLARGGNLGKFRKNVNIAEFI